MSVSFPPSLIGPYFRVVHTLVTVGTTAQILIGRSPNRVLIYVAAVSTSPIIIAPHPQVISTRGHQVLFGSAPTLIDYGTWGALVGQEWYAVVNAGNSTTMITEVMYDPRE